MAEASGTTTFLFTDLADSTEPLDRLGEDAIEGLRRVHFQLLRQAVSTAGGREVKSLGDGLMVVFRSAVDAVACAVSLQQAADRHSRRTAGDALSVRVGINVGEPIHDEDDYFGTAVVVAQRFCDTARGGQILASDLVRALVGRRSQHDIVPLGETTLGGLSEPLATCEIVWQPRGDITIALPRALTAMDASAFVGRADELARLDACWSATTAGRRQLAFVVGEPGIGKSRLVAELARAVHGRGATVLFGRCDEENLVAYQPFVEALTTYANAADVESLRADAGRAAADLGRLVPELLGRLNVEPAEQALDAETDRYRLFEAVDTFLTNIAESAPVLLVLDDLHWADRASLRLLHHLARLHESSPVLILGTYRDVEVERGHGLAALLADLRREHPFERVVLPGLAEEEVVLLLASATPAVLDTRGRAVAHTIWAETDGNPLFVREILGHFLDGAPSDSDFWSHVDMGTLVIPEGIVDVISRRLARLSDATNRALVLASIVGRSFDTELLQELSGQDEDELLGALESATQAGLVAEDPTRIGRYGFTHAVVRDAIYGQLSASRRVRLHRQAGAALERLYADDLDQHLPALAAQFAAGADVETARTAADYARRAGNRAATLIAHEESARYFELALDALALAGTADTEERAELLLALGRAQLRAGDADNAKDTMRRATAEARQLGRDDWVAEAALEFAGVATGGLTDDEVVRMLVDAIAGLGDDAPAPRARLTARLAMERTATAATEARVLSAEAVAIARGVGDRGTLASVLGGHHWLHGQEAVEDQLTTATEIVSLAEMVGDRELQFQGHHYRGHDLLVLGDMDACDRELEMATALAEELRQPQYLWQAAVYRVMRALLRGRFATAARLADDAVEVGRRGQSDNALLAWTIHQFLLGFERGGLEALADEAPGFAAAYPSIVAWRAAVAMVLADVGRHDEARTLVEGFSPPDFSALPPDANRLLGLVLLAHACAALDDAERSASLYDLLAPYASQTVVVGNGIGCFGSVALALGLAAQTARRWADAERQLHAARARARQVGAPSWAARAEYAWARMLCERDEPGDKDHALRLVTSALTTTRELDMQTLTARLEAVERACAPMADRT